MNGYSTYSFHDFVMVNAHNNFVYIAFILLALVFYLIARQIRYKTDSVTKTKIKKQYVSTGGDTEM